jgi:hypothetical protein
MFERGREYGSGMMKDVDENFGVLGKKSRSGLIALAELTEGCCCFQKSLTGKAEELR